MHIDLHIKSLKWYIHQRYPSEIHTVNTLRPRRNEQHFADDICKRIFFNENVWISIKISLKFVPKCPMNNIPALVQIMAWRRSGDKPLSEPMMVSLPTHICVTRPQCVKCDNMTYLTWLVKGYVQLQYSVNFSKCVLISGILVVDIFLDLLWRFAVNHDSTAQQFTRKLF